MSNYLNDQNIIEYLISIDEFLSINKSIQNTDCFAIGYITASTVEAPKEFKQQIDAIKNLLEFVQAGVLLESHKMTIYIEAMYNSKCQIPSLIEKVMMGLEQNQEEEKISESERKARVDMKNLLESTETTLLALAYDEKDPISFDPIDVLVWGMLTKHYNKGDMQQPLKLIKQVREAEVASLCNLNQKLRIFIKFYNDPNTDPSPLLEKIVVDPSLGSKPLSDLRITEEQKQKLSALMASQLQLQEQFDVEKARIEKDKKENESVECSVCFEKLIDKTVAFTNLDNCGHLFHETCLSEYVKQQLKDRKVPINCPSCLVEMNYNDFAQFFNEEKLEELDRILFKQFTDQRMKDASWCPTPDCPYVFELKKEDLAPGSEWNGEFTCPLCEHKYCLRCRIDFHEGQSCEEWQKENEKRIDIAAVFEKLQYKKCPFCGYWVEKTVGCNHMRCSCGRDFCYGCGRVYSDCRCYIYSEDEDDGDYYEVAVEDGKDMMEYFGNHRFHHIYNYQYVQYQSPSRAAQISDKYKALMERLKKRQSHNSEKQDKTEKKKSKKKKH